VRVNFVGKKNRKLQSHGIGLRLRDKLDTLAGQHNAKIQIVELPPGPPVLASLVAEVYGNEGSEYREILRGAQTVAQRMEREPGVAEVDDIREAPVNRLVFEPDQEKAALAGISAADIAQAVETAVNGSQPTAVRVSGERQPLKLTFRMPKANRSSPEELSQLGLKTRDGRLIPMKELGTWRLEQVSQTIYHKNLRRVAYVFAECAGRPPAECVIDILSDQQPSGEHHVADNPPVPLKDRTFLNNGSGIGWRLPDDINVTFAGEGDWNDCLIGHRHARLNHSGRLHAAIGGAGSSVV
jgi:multidrug efflux pump subunit AcrB